ncbi:MAG: hypothetical protein WAU21_10760 [Chitinophagales bacterium]|nr:hypothetical protein [Bacteroidota bacterium]MBK8488932.1 hypothetical protein [Bacteroidota bacterium]MBK8680780.1 hypothetical protein [Bacteroidota bacterium]
MEDSNPDYNRGNNGVTEESRCVKKEDSLYSQQTGDDMTGPASPLDLFILRGTSASSRLTSTPHFGYSSTGVTPVPLFVPPPPPQDEKLHSTLRKESDKIYKKNKEWWNMLRLDKFNPFEPLDPVVLPNSYANRVMLTQRYFNESGVSENLFLETQKIEEDGIFGISSMACLFVIWQLYHNKHDYIIETLKKAQARYKILSCIKELDKRIKVTKTDDEKLLIDLEKYVFASLYKPEALVKWYFDSDIEAIAAFLIQNHRIAITDPNNEWGFLDETSLKESDESDELNTAIAISKSINGIFAVFAKHEDDAVNMQKNLSFNEKVQVLRILYANKPIKTYGIFYEVERPYFHPIDLDGINPKKNYKELSLRFLLKNPDYVDKIEPVLKIVFPKTRAVLGAKKKTRIQSFKNTALGLFYYLPVFGAKEFTAAKKYISDIVIEQEAKSQAAMQLFAQIQSESKRRLKEPADIDNPEVLIDMLTWPLGPQTTNSVKLLTLYKKSEDTFFLIVKFDKGEAFVLTNRQINESRAIAFVNDKLPLRMGSFKPPDNIQRIDTQEFAVKKRSDGSMEISYPRSDYPLKYPLLSCDTFDPVKVQIGLLDPDASTATQFVRDTFTSRNWSVQSIWCLGAVLDEVAKEVKDSVRTAQGMQGLDLVITTVTAIFTLYSPLKASAATGTIQLASGITISLTRKLITNLFWFAVSEGIAQKIMDFDARINSDKVNYTDDERKTWNTFKFGLLIFGGTMIIRQAWKGLKAMGSTAFKNAFLEVEELIKAESKTLKSATVLGKATERLYKITEGIKDFKAYAKDVMDLSSVTLRDLADNQIALLKTLPDWALNFIKGMSDELVRLLFGCKSPCKVDLPYIKKSLGEKVLELFNIKKIKGILPAEITLINNTFITSIDRLIKHAIVYAKNIDTIKGFITEELFFYSAAYKRILAETVERAIKMKFDPSEILLIKDIRGMAPKLKTAGALGQLTDGALVVIRKGKLYVLAVFESKSKSNYKELVQKRGETTGQLMADFERFKLEGESVTFTTKKIDPVTLMEIEEIHIFKSEDVVISYKKPTAWVGIIPPKILNIKTKTELLTKAKELFKDFELVEGEVRDEIIKNLAKSMVDIISDLNLDKIVTNK